MAQCDKCKKEDESAQTVHLDMMPNRPEDQEPYHTTMKLCNNCAPVVADQLNNKLDSLGLPNLKRV